tara:strand:- start:94 stop:357 length:264 start_codon:yes stop_codon:yes gene_type:complete
MTSGKNQSKLPKWFKGDVYHEGDVVRNPFSGEEYRLNAEELSMYDFIMGSQMCFDMGMTNEKIIDEHNKGLRWFSKNNIEAYMILLD